VIAWLADADSAKSYSALSAALGTQVGDADSLTQLLMQRKTYAPTQQLVCQVLAGIPSCRERATELLNDIADVARQADGARKHFIVTADPAFPAATTARLNA
jgi:hypothetical protein